MKRTLPLLLPQSKLMEFRLQCESRHEDLWPFFGPNHIHIHYRACIAHCWRPVHTRATDLSRQFTRVYKGLHLPGLTLTPLSLHHLGQHIYAPVTLLLSISMPYILNLKGMQTCSITTDGMQLTIPINRFEIQSIRKTSIFLLYNIIGMYINNNLFQRP